MRSSSVRKLKFSDLYVFENFLISIYTPRQLVLCKKIVIIILNEDTYMKYKNMQLGKSCGLYGNR